MLIKTVLRGGLAEQAGLMAGDEWLGVERAGGDGWRLSKLQDLPLYTRPGEVVTALVARDHQLLRLSLQLPAAAKAAARPAPKRSGKSPAAPDTETPANIKLGMQDAAVAAKWLAAQ